MLFNNNTELNNGIRRHYTLYRADIIDHLRGIRVGTGSVEVYELRSIIEGLLQEVQSKTYYNDLVLITIKALKEVGVELGLPKTATTLDYQALRAKLRGQ
jgi:hypothetical protein